MSKGAERPGVVRRKQGAGGSIASKEREAAASWWLLRMPATAGGYSALFDSILFFFLRNRFDLVADWDWD